MATLNYATRLSKLQQRKFDTSLNESALSKSFSSIELPEDLKYLAESMQPLDSKFNLRTREAAENVEKHLERGFQLAFKRAYRNQGSVMTNTNIKASDIDLLTVIDSYQFLPTGQIPRSPYQGDEKEDIIELRRQTINILKEQYDEVDATGAKCVGIFNKNLRRKVDVVLSYWYDSKEYQDTRNNYYRGIYIYNFKENQKQLDFPFAHIENVQEKGNATRDGSRKAIRLLKNLKEDADVILELTSFQLTTIVHSIPDINLLFESGLELRLAENVSVQLRYLIDDAEGRKLTSSPNGTEKPLFEDKTVASLKLLKSDLDQLIVDCKLDLRGNVIEKSLKNYI